MNLKHTAKLILETGEVYCGYAFGWSGTRVLELVFNTSMVGYQEILSDPSYTDQAVVMTYPLIGNYGMAPEDYETVSPSIGGLIVREYNPCPSNFRSKKTLEQVMEQFQIPGIQGVDTRRLTRSIRDLGSRKCLITANDITAEAALEILAQTEIARDAVSRVSCKSPQYTCVPHARYHVVAIDCGMKANIVRSLHARHCDVTIVPWNTPWEKIDAMQPDGLFISNGPGDPVDVKPVIETVRFLRGHFPIFGICLGHQIIALSYGAETYKLKFGHRGGNHPVKNLLTNKVEITSQNHSYAVKQDSLEKTPLVCTHINLLDQTVEGLACPADHVFSVQYHPESAPGPQDSAYLFDQFIQMMEEVRTHG